jgi:methionyl-tRNA formyltransferase
MSEQKVILICGNPIAIPVLRDLVFHQQLAVLVVPKRCTAFIQEVQQLFAGSNIPMVLVTADNFALNVQQAIQQYNPSIGFVFTCSYKIPAAIYNLPEKGFFNIHPGPLPAYRGPDPIFRQIKNRERYAAISIHQLDDGFDTGPVAISNKMPLPVADTYGMLSKKLGELATQAVSTLLKIAAFGVHIPLKQQDHSKAVFYQKQAAADISINWQTMDAPAIVALINACNPWNKGAVTHLNQNIIRLLEASVVENNTIENVSPGTICAINVHGITIATAAGCILVRMIYSNEGFLTPDRLLAFGVLPGHSFAMLPV